MKVLHCTRNMQRQGQQGGLVIEAGAAVHQQVRVERITQRALHRHTQHTVFERVYLVLPTTTAAQTLTRENAISLLTIQLSTAYNCLGLRQKTIYKGYNVLPGDMLKL